MPRLLFSYTWIKSGRAMTHLRIVPKRDPTRHELEQQLDALPREYGVTKDKKVLEQMLEFCGRLRELNKT